jgi:hypothetical protein
MNAAKWALLLATMPVLLLGDRHLPPKKPATHSVAVTQQEFQLWAAGSPDRSREYQAFVAFLMKENVGDILPPWSLLIPDRQYVSPRCPIEAFVIPPRSLWPNAVPTLKFLRSHIIPALGPIRVSSAFRSSDFNKCIGGAPKSAHLSFSAFDLVTTTPMNRDVLFTSLCKTWRTTPVSAKFGLGAYYNAGTPSRNIIGRFHVDTLGKRTWGSDFRSRSSFCNAAR